MAVGLVFASGEGEGEGAGARGSGLPGPGAPGPCPGGLAWALAAGFGLVSGVVVEFADVVSGCEERPF